MKTERKCHGTGKAAGHGCGKMVPQVHNGKANRVYGIGKSCGCYQKWLRSTPEGKKKMESAIVIGRKKAEKTLKQKEKEEKDKIIDYPKKLQERVNEIARLIDIGLPCLARGYHANQIHGGHIFSRGSSRPMRYNLHNLHRQGAQSNHFQNEDGLLREGLKNEYGLDYYEFLSSLQRIPPLKFSNAEFKNFYKTACGIANLLKKEGRNFNLEQRIKMRNQINIDLGIYEKEYCEFKK